jgi:FkbH-like protein
MHNSLKYPIDSEFILRKRRAIKRSLFNNELTCINIKVAILGGSTTSEIKNILDLFLLNSGLKADFYESDYGRYYEDSLFENKDLDKFNPDIVYIHTTNVNISQYPGLTFTESQVKELLKREMEKYISIWQALSKYDCSIIQNNFELTLDRSLGNLDCYDFHGKTWFINRLNERFSEYAKDNKGLYINDINYLSAYIGLNKWFDRSLWYQAKYALSMKAIPELAHGISKIINAIIGRNKKCLVLDLDNTCWGGVIGDDGLNGIRIGSSTAEAESFTAFQLYIKELKMRGVTLAVCSKNNINNAKLGFEHPDSILKFNDFSSFKANWKQKHKNIYDIAEEINIGMDSMVFIDDNPVERKLVSSQIPDVTTPNIGDEALYFIEYIDREGYFEPISLSQEDRDRNLYYRDNKIRLKKQAKFKNYDDFLLSLNMSAEIKTINSMYLDRVTQLINKTNQFNLTMARYTIGEVENILYSNSFIKIYGRLADRYGDNGLISVSVGVLKGDECHIELWLMSCRVIKRGMEFAMFDEFINECKKAGVVKVVGYYFQHNKNKMVSNMYKSFGFLLTKEDNGNTTWELYVVLYKFKNKLIRVNNG